MDWFGNFLRVWFIIMVEVAKMQESEVMGHLVSIVRKQRWTHTSAQFAFSFLFGPGQIQPLNSIAHIQG